MTNLCYRFNYFYLFELLQGCDRKEYVLKQ